MTDDAPPPHSNPDRTPYDDHQADPLTVLQDELDGLNAKITKQGALVRTLKKSSASDANAIAEAVDALKALKLEGDELRKKQDELDPAKKFERKTFDELVLRRMYVVPSFEIHGGVKGLFDLGPPGCALKVRMVECRVWDCSFVCQTRLGAPRPTVVALDLVGSIDMRV